MFGYIVANKGALNEQQLERYRGCYCGLCWALKERHSMLCRLTLNFDMTFLIIMLSSMYEPESENGAASCVVHPTKKHPYWKNEFSGYAADMNISLAYYNCVDDWKDDKDLVKLLQSKILKSHFERVKDSYPRQVKAIEDSMKSISELEASGNKNPDAASNCFGELMGELFVYHEDMFASGFRAFGQSLGRFIYMMDACVDLEKDKKHGSYNPLLLLDEEPDDEQILLTLKVLIGDCTGKFEKLPLVQDVDIMRNVLYSGVWARYAQKKQKQEEKRGTKDDK